MYYQAPNNGPSNAAAQNSNQGGHQPSWEPQKKNSNKSNARQGQVSNRRAADDSMPSDGGLDGGLNMGSIVGSDGYHPLGGEKASHGGGGGGGGGGGRGGGGGGLQGSSSGRNGASSHDDNNQQGQQHQAGLQPIRLGNMNSNRSSGHQGGGGSGASPRAQQQQQQHQQQQHQQQQQQLQLQSQQHMQQQQQQYATRDSNGRRNRGVRHGNTRGRRQKTGNSVADGNSQLSVMNNNSVGGGGSNLQQPNGGGGTEVGMGSMFQMGQKNGNGGGGGAQGQNNRGGGGGEGGLPQLVNSMGHASRRQPQQQQQQQQGQQQQQQMQNQQVAGVPRESLPSYVEEHQWASTTSIKGLKPGNPNWINQDNFFIIERFDNRDINFYCVLDGHGEHGHHVSRHCRNAFPQHIRASNLDMKRAFNIMQNDLNSCEFDVRCSGATCVLAALCGARLSVSNCGDSRAVLGRRNPNGSVTAHALTQDHKPDKPEERKRILACGGHLGCRQVVVNQPGRGPVSMPVGPCRVWYQNRGETLGLAMSRSLGDSIVHRSGVSAEPETLEHIVDEFDEFMIIATDGVWDVIDNNQAVQMVQNFSTKSPKWNALDASNTICKFARSRWEKLSPMVDDITCIVVKLQRR